MFAYSKVILVVVNEYFLFSKTLLLFLLSVSVVLGGLF